MKAFESGVLDLPDFYFTGDAYRYRFEAQAKRRFLDLVKERFNAGVKYGGRVMKWDTVIERKAIELGRFLLGRSPRLDFSDPSPTLRTSERELRSKVVGLTSSEARRHGIGKSTLHYLRRRAGDQKPFTIYEPVLARLRD
jgi:hypothetical protein